ncbi:MAG: translocation/assembly module TamB domain-containing protein [Ferruginibacter sp.]
MLHLSVVQTWVVGHVASNLSTKLHTRVTIKKVDFSFFNKMELQGLMIEDRKKDTMLYAGTARLNITDWFFLKEKVSLNYIGLENAIVNMNRMDSTWNYQFLIDYFSSPSSSTTKKKNIELTLNEVHLVNVRFNKIDKWVGQNMIAYMNKLDLLMDFINYEKKRISIKELNLEQAEFSQSDYEGRKPDEPSLANVLEKIPLIQAFKWNNSGWEMNIKKINLTNSSFRNDKFTVRPAYTNQFDGQHIFFSAITGSLQDIIVRNDTMTATVSLTAKEQSGLLLKKLQSNMKFTPDLMEFKKLDLQTNRSKLGPYYSMSYKAFNQDFNSFIHNVLLEANFKESILNSDDLAYFSPQLSNWRRVFYLNGNAKGTIDNFSARDMKIRSGSTFLEGDIALRGLPDINSSFIDFRSKTFQTNYQELATLIPAFAQIKMPALYKLGNIGFTGNFTGFLNDFVTYGSFSSALGPLSLDLNMKLPAGKPAVYSGKIATNGFNLGAFLNNKNLGNIAISGKINGRGFKLNELNAGFNGVARSFYAFGHNYQNLTINGNFERKLFTGHLSSDDPNLKINRLDGSINLSGDELSFDADADLGYVNLKELGLSKDKISFSGLFNLHFTGNNIDNFLGNAKIYNASLLHEDARLSFDSLVLNSRMEGNNKILTLASNELDASITGQFKIAKLPDAFRVFLSHYYPAYIKPPDYLVSNQDFSFSIKTKNADQYISLFDKRLRGFNDAAIDGSLALARNELTIKAQVPEFSYAGKVFTNTLLTGRGNRDTLYTEVAVEDIQLNDSLHLPDTKLTLSAHNDISLVKLTTSAGKTLSDAELNAGIQTYNDGVRVHFFPSSFVVNDKRWELRKDGELTIRKNFTDVNDISFVHENQQIVLSSELDDVTDKTHLVAKLTHVNIEDFLPFVLVKPAFKGLITGTAMIREPFGKTWIEFDGTADSLVMDEHYIGKVNLKGNANTSTGLVKFSGSANDKEYVFSVDGSYNYLDSTGNNLSIGFLTDKFNLNILEPYLGSIFSQVSGNAKSNLTIKSGPDYPRINGDVTVTDGSLKVAFTQCRYTFTNHTIKFRDDKIDIGIMPLKDTLNNEGTASGKITHHFFKDFVFNDLKFETNRMLLLNTTKKDNNQFYGTVTGNAVMSLNGPITNMRMNIDGQPSVLDSSHIYLPTGSVARENKAIDYIDFIQFGTEMETTQRNNQQTNMLVNMNFSANPACKVDVILDEETGDVIKGQGNGQLNIRVGTTEPLSIRGRYDLTRGEYTFKFQTFLKKPFTLSNGSIIWNGDPYLAVLDIDAEYMAKNVNLSDLSPSGGYRQKEDIIILSHISGNLKSPVISFEFQLPERSELNRDYLIVKRLADFNNDPNEQYKQVASLLLFNQFILGAQNFLSGQNTLSLATNTIGGVVSSWLTTVFNKELERATNGVISTYIDINPTVDLQRQASQLQASVKAGLKILLSNRVNILIGGNLDYNNPYAQLNRKGLLTPDITIEWLLNKDGSIRVVGFNRTSIDLTNGQRNRSGVQLSYRKNFNKLSDIFKSRKKLQQEDEKTKVKIGG